MTEAQREAATEKIRVLVHLMHTEEYALFPEILDGSVWPPDLIQECMSHELRVLGVERIDEFGTPCDFEPEYEGDAQLRFYEYTDGTGFAADYELSADGIWARLCLQLAFFYKEDGLRCIFESIAPEYY